MSYTVFQSQPSAPEQTVFQAFVSSQTYWPPATQWLALFTSISIGAMNRGFGSHRAGGSVAVRHDGEISGSVVHGAVGRDEHVEVDVLLDRAVAVVRVDDRVAAVTGERLLDVGQVRSPV